MATTLAPKRYADVTADWLTEALRDRWPGVAVSSIRHGPVFGYKQNKFRVTVDYARGGDTPPPTFIVKGNFPGEQDPSTGSAWAMATELRSIRDVAPLVDAPAGPQWYHIVIDDEAAGIVMEDLSPARARFFDAFHTLGLGQAMAFMDAFARMHASAWDSPIFATGGALGPGTLAAENRRLVNEVYFPTFFEPDSWQNYVALPRGRALPNAYQNLDRMQRAWESLWSVMRQTATVVIHGDEHLGNLYVTADGRPGLIDWVARPEHWPIGLSYFMLCALDVLDRRQWERALLAHYLTRLAAYGAPHVPLMDEAWFFYRCATVYPVVTWLNNSAVWQPEAINTANLVRAVTAAIDHDALTLLGA